MNKGLSRVVVSTRRRASYGGWMSLCRNSIKQQQINGYSSWWCSSNISATTPPPRRPFHSCRVHYNTNTNNKKQITTLTGLKITNPRYDSDHHLMAVDVTPKAASKLVSLIKQDNNPDIVLRVSVESGGCHGFQYLMSLQTTSDISPDDTVLDRNGGKVVMDEMTLDILRDSKLDYTTELIGSQFKIVDNPRATSSCGCGTSFDLDLDKAVKKASNDAHSM